MHKLSWMTAAVALLSLAQAAPGFAQCNVCKPCETDAECGPGLTCYDFPVAGRYCTQTPCTVGECPGNSVCYTVGLPTGSGQFCINPDGNQSICGTGWTCEDTGSGCPSLGVDCSAGPMICFDVGAALCVTITENSVSSSFCTCYCSVDADCGGGNRCISLGSGSRVCRPGPTTGLCSGVVCDIGEVCDPGTGNCVNPNDLCANVTCPPGAMCSPATGTCIGGADNCSTVVCLPGYTCDPADGLCHQNTADPLPDSSDVSDTSEAVEVIEITEPQPELPENDDASPPPDSSGDTSAGDEGGRVIVVDNCACAIRNAGQDSTLRATLLGLLLAFAVLVRRRARG